LIGWVEERIPIHKAVVIMEPLRGYAQVHSKGDIMMQYNGYTNYETWCVDFWINNEKDIFDEVCDITTETMQKESLVRRRDVLAEKIKDFVDVMNPLSRNCMG